MTSYIGPFRVQRMLGAGGTGNVYLCDDVETGRPACVKTPRASLPREREALRREVLALSRLNRHRHPGIVRLLRTGVNEDLPWYAMEYVEGTPLSRFGDGVESITGAAGAAETEAAAFESGQEPRREDLGRLVRISAALADTLDLIHSEGIVHGDLSPANVVVRATSQEPVLMDFGESFLAHEGGLLRELVQARDRLHGTAAYMAPERREGRFFDARCDLYSLGCILYELFTGRPPFQGRSLEDIALQHRIIAPRPPSFYSPWLPRELEALIGRLLLKRPSDRDVRSRDVAEILFRLSGTEPSHQPRARAFALYRPRMTGREEALATLAALGESLRRKHGGLVLVFGDSGVGKTRLVNEFGALAAEQGVTVLSTRCIKASADADGHPLTLRDLEPFLSVVERIADECRSKEGLRDDIGPDVDTVLHHVTVTPPSDAPPALSKELSNAARSRVLRALGRTLLRFSSERPLLLLVDDLQWADELSSAFLLELAPELAGHGLLIVGTFRTEQAADELARLRAAATTQLALRPLSHEDVRVMARDMLGVLSLPEGLSHFLFERSEGNPLFASEHLRAAIERGRLRRGDDGAWRFEADTGSSHPSSLDELVRLRLTNLSTKAAATLQLAAVLGREFQVDVLSALPDASDSVDGEALEELVARQTLEWVAPRRYRFVHDRLREALEGALDLETRQHLHRLAALRLEAMSADDRTSATSGEIGVHWSLAGEPQRALPYIWAAAREAEAASSPTRAAEFYEAAVRQCERVRASSPGLLEQELAQLLEKLSDAWMVQARHLAARAALTRALECTPAGERLARARLHRKIAASHWTLHEYDAARVHLDTARAELGAQTAEGVEEFREYIEIEIGRLEHLYFSRNVGPETQELITKLEPIVHRYGSPAQRCYYYVGAACELAARRRYAWSPDSVSFARHALTHGAESLASLQIALARLAIGFLLLPGGEDACREALSVLRDAERDAVAAADSTLVSRVLTYQTLTLVRLRDRSGARANAERSLAAAEAVQLTPYIAAALACQGWSLWADGDVARADPLLTKALSLWREHPHPFPFMWVALFPSLDLELTASRFARARELMTLLVHPTQQELAPELTTAIEHTLSVDEASAPESFHRAALNVLEHAQRLRYC